MIHATNKSLSAGLFHLVPDVDVAPAPQPPERLLGLLRPSAGEQVDGGLGDEGNGGQSEGWKADIDFWVPIASNQTYPTWEGNADASENHPVNEGPESVHEKHAGGDHERDQRSQDPCFDSFRVISESSNQLHYFYPC